jgi:hypothetical protein
MARKSALSAASTHSTGATAAVVVEHPLPQSYTMERAFCAQPASTPWTTRTNGVHNPRQTVDEQPLSVERQPSSVDRANYHILCSETRGYHYMLWFPA